MVVEDSVEQSKADNGKNNGVVTFKNVFKV
jgi:hypothetical protein